MNNNHPLPQESSSDLRPQPQEFSKLVFLVQANECNKQAQTNTAASSESRICLNWLSGALVGVGGSDFIGCGSPASGSRSQGRRQRGEAGGAKRATSVNVPPLRPQSSEGKFTLSLEIEPVRRFFRGCRSCTFTEVTGLAPSRQAS